MNIKNPDASMNTTGRNARLCWTRRELVEATGLCYRTIINLETRGLLHRCMIGVNVACYPDTSVRALFGAKAGQKEPPA